MTLKFLSRPQLGRNPRGADSVVERMPPGALPIHTAPENTRFVAVDASGQQHWAMRYKGGVHKLREHRDFKSGAQRFYGDGPITAVGWVPPRRG